MQYGTPNTYGTINFPIAYTATYSVATGGYAEGGCVVSFNYTLTTFKLSIVGWNAISVNNVRWISIGY